MSYTILEIQRMTIQWRSDKNITYIHQELKPNTKKLKIEKYQLHVGKLVVVVQ